jgi:sarcosine oxidase subunit gamma
MMGVVALRGTDGTTLREIPRLTLISLRIRRLDGCLAAAVAQSAGITLSREVGEISCATAGFMLCLGPDEWLLVAPPGRAGEFIAPLTGLLTARSASVIDVSASRTTLELAGPGAHDALAGACRVDLHERALPIGRCAQTLVAKARAIIYRTNLRPTFRLLVDTSFRDYVVAWLGDGLDCASAAYDDPTERRT